MHVCVCAMLVHMFVYSIQDILAVGYGAKKSGTFMESEGLICCWSLKNLEVCWDYIEVLLNNIWNVLSL